MKTNRSSLTARVTISALFVLGGISLFCAIPFLNTRAQNPTSGAVGPSPGGPSASWDQTITTPGGGINTEAACVDGVNCEGFTLTVNWTAANWTGQKVQVRLTWARNGNEYDVNIHKGATT